MYFDFDSAVDDMATNPNHQQQTVDDMASSNPHHQTAVVSMQQLLNNPSPAPQPVHMQWSSATQGNGQELPAMQLPQDNRQQHHQNRHHLAQSHRYQHHPLHPQEHRPLQSEIKPVVNKPTNTYELDDSPDIEPHIVMQMGGLPYADLCKEKAREAFKDMKKNEHMAKGEFDRMKRRKKGDTSMTAREKYVRRLKMNQDSAAAARYAQEVYVHVLEKLVKTTEDEKKAFMMQVQQLQQENSRLQDKVSHLQSTREPTLDPQTLFDAPEKIRRVYDPSQLAKLLDIMTDPETVSAQDNDPNFAAGNMGIQPARAV